MKTLVSHIKDWFLAKGYPEIVFNNQINQVIFGRDQSVKKDLESYIPLVTTTYLHNVKELGKEFSPSPIVSYRSARNIK